MSRRSFKRYLSRRNSALNDLQLNQAYDVIDRDHSDSISAGELAKYLHEQEEDGDEDEKGVVEAEHDEETSVQVVAELSKKIILSSSEKSKALWDESIELFVVSVATLVDQVKSLKNDLREKIKKLLSSKMEVVMDDNLAVFKEIKNYILSTLNEIDDILQTSRKTLVQTCNIFKKNDVAYIINEFKTCFMRLRASLEKIADKWRRFPHLLSFDVAWPDISLSVEGIVVDMDKMEAIRKVCAEALDAIMIFAKDCGKSIIDTISQEQLKFQSLLSQVLPDMKETFEAFIEKLTPSIQIKSLTASIAPVMKSLEKYIHDGNAFITSLQRDVENHMDNFNDQVFKLIKAEWAHEMVEKMRAKLLEPLGDIYEKLLLLEGIVEDIKGLFHEYLDEGKRLAKEINLIFNTRLTFLILQLGIGWDRCLACFQKDFLWQDIHFQLSIHGIDHKLYVPVKSIVDWSMDGLGQLKFSSMKSLTFNLNNLLENILTVELPKYFIDISTLENIQTFQIGGWLMKLKIFIGFAQCFAYFPITFEVPWPKSLLAFMKMMEFTALDMYAVFGVMSCKMQTGFLQKFVYHMLVFPILLAIVGAVYLFAKCTYLRPKYTEDSLKTQVLTLISLVSFALYTGVSIRIFRLFKCKTFQNVRYLTEDYTTLCQGEEYTTYAAVGVLCIFLYVLGIPGYQLYKLYKNRKNLHAESCENRRLQLQLVKEYGSIYEHYTMECYYYDIVDLARRLLLTGGLIMMGEESIGQIFLGIIVCLMWLCLIIYKRPYKVGLDNTIAIVLAAHLLLTLISGMALKLYEATPGQDEYQREGFGIVLVFVSVLAVLLSLSSTLLSTPCVQKFIKSKAKRSRNSSKLEKKKSKYLRGSGVVVEEQDGNANKLDNNVKEKEEEISNHVANDEVVDINEVGIELASTLSKKEDE